MISVALCARALAAKVSANKSAPLRDQLAHNFVKGADLIERTVMAGWKATPAKGPSLNWSRTGKGNGSANLSVGHRSGV